MYITKPLVVISMALEILFERKKEKSKYFFFTLADYGCHQQSYQNLHLPIQMPGVLWNSEQLRDSFEVTVPEAAALNWQEKKPLFLESVPPRIYKKWQNLLKLSS